MSKTLYEKIWDRHLISTKDDGTSLIYIDRHLIHEVTSPQPFESIRMNKRVLWRKDSIVATVDHNTPTDNWDRNRGVDSIADPVSRIQVKTLDDNIRHFGSKVYFPFQSKEQGIIHIISPEQGLILPGMTVVCGDSHTSTHGAMACLAHGIGTSEVEHVLVTQTLVTKKAKTMLIEVSNELQDRVYPKDLALYIIGQIGTAGGTGYHIEFAGECIRGTSIEGRMTICNMAIEAGARAAIVAVDEKTIDYLRGRNYAPKGESWDRAVEFWRTLKSDPDAKFDRVVKIDASKVLPQVTWGTSPEMVVSIDSRIPVPEFDPDPNRRAGMIRALEYMGLEPETPLEDIKLDKVFIGSCTNSRIEDLRQAASVVRGRKKASNIKLAMVVPGSGLVKSQAEKEGLDKIFIDAGFEWRNPGCSMCLAMNSDRLNEGERCASTSNRNFEGRQGFGGRTHLLSPAMAAAAAIKGSFIDIRNF